MNKITAKLFIIIVILTSCVNDNHHRNMTIKERIRSVDALFEGSKVEQAAKYMKRDDYKSIKKFFKNNPDILVDTRSPFTGATLLQVASARKKQNAVKALLESGADPNFEELEIGSQSRSSFTHAFFTRDTMLLKLYIEYGADVNKVSEMKSTLFRTPLMAASKAELSLVKFLISQGADPHYVYTKNNESALNAAILSADIDIVNYLIFEQKVDFKKPYYYNRQITAGLRNICYPIGSRKYKEKMKLVSFLKDNGMDYYAEPIPKRFYKLFDEDYLSKY